MTRIQFTTALGAALLVVSCEPLPVYPPGHRRPQPDSYYDSNSRNNQRADGSYNSPDSRYDDRGGNQNSRYDNQSSPPRQPTRDQYPVAERTNNRDRVISPYSPYNVIDVEGFRSGQLAKDPSNGKIFRIP